MKGSLRLRIAYEDVKDGTCSSLESLLSSSHCRPTPAVEAYIELSLNVRKRSIGATNVRGYRVIEPCGDTNTLYTGHDRISRCRLLKNQYIVLFRGATIHIHPLFIVHATVTGGLSRM
jgi:hypothetical protein